MSAMEGEIEPVLLDRGPRDRGPVLVVTAGLHGNEPGGVLALRRLARRLDELAPPLRGRILGLAGNRGALEEGRRYRDEDLNRIWTEERIRRLRSAGEPRTAEEIELVRLVEALADAFRSAPDPARRYYADLHSTSGPGLPFILASADPRPHFADELPLPEIFGMEELLLGTAMNWYSVHGIPSIALEGGQNDDPRTAEVLETFLWLAMVSIGIIAADAIPDLAERRAWLEEVTSGVPRRVMVEYRHEIRPDDAFRMEPGFQNLQSVPSGTLVARDRHRDYRTKEDAWMLFPLYQGQGNDGFFLARPLD
ncbi:MAG: succinylglutamate desuccinylase/aspartoacylase family protein [Planctomycetota bacterium]